jgi:hypothetical protein
MGSDSPSGPAPWFSGSAAGIATAAAASAPSAVVRRLTHLADSRPLECGLELLDGVGVDRRVISALHGKPKRPVQRRQFVLA